MSIPLPDPEHSCATCRFGVVVEVPPTFGFRCDDYRHCAMPRDGLPVRAWFIAARAGCGHDPVRWEPKK